MQPTSAIHHGGRPRLPDSLRQARRSEAIQRSRYRQSQKRRAYSGGKRRASQTPHGSTTITPSFVPCYGLDQHPAHWDWAKPANKRRETGHDSRYRPKFHAADFLTALSKCAQTSSFVDVQNWALVSEAGFPTLPHMDGNGFETFITVLEGEIAFVWWHQPSEAALDQWAKDTQLPQGGDWRFLVLGRGDTVFFPSGIVHMVLRQCQDQQFGSWGRNGRTFAYGGHILRYSRIAAFSGVMQWQMKQLHAGLPVTNVDALIENGIRMTSPT